MRIVNAFVIEQHLTPTTQPRQTTHFLPHPQSAFPFLSTSSEIQQPEGGEARQQIRAAKRDAAAHEISFNQA
jgi:hypothetical protein